MEERLWLTQNLRLLHRMQIRALMQLDVQHQSICQDQDLVACASLVKSQDKVYKVGARKPPPCNLLGIAFNL